jgi:hypothetical protein
MKPLFGICVVFIMFFWHCSSPTKPSSEKTSRLVITNVWISDAVDLDEDGYCSNLYLNFDLDVANGSKEVFIKLGYKTTGDESQTYTLCFESVRFTVSGVTDEDAKYIELNDLESELPSGEYDFLLQVFDTAEPDQVIAEATPGAFNQLASIKLETMNEDQQLMAAWLSWNDGTFESSRYFPPPDTGGRIPVGAYTTILGLATRFERPDDVSSCMIKKIRVHIQTIRTAAQLTFSLYDEGNELPDEIIYKHGSSINLVEGWNEIELDYDITMHPVFYVFIAASSAYDLSVDTSGILPGEVNYTYQYTYRAVADPDLRETYSWPEFTEGNHAIDVLVEYSPY